MWIRVLTLVLSLCLLVIGGLGCDFQSDTLTSGISDEGFDASEDEPLIADKFFTGRDSFGVAFKVRLSGDAVVTNDDGCDDETVTLDGFGNATHLGQIQGSFTHCIEEGDFSSVFGGQFELVGSTGGQVSGEYEPLPRVDKHGPHGRRNGAGDVFETVAEVTGGEVSAVEHDPLEGRGDLRLVIKENDTFEVIFDGWLLHHVVEEEE